jgi:hypothetical protein
LSKAVNGTLTTYTLDPGIENKNSTFADIQPHKQDSIFKINQQTAPIMAQLKNSASFIAKWQ